MTNTKSTKRALLVSVMAMVICFTMLLGTTFAWFTDSEVSNNNIIKSGNLDVTFEYSQNGTDWYEVASSSELFDDDALWEPGYTDVVYLRVQNIGTLALNYQIGINIASETPAKNVDGNELVLSNYIDYGVAYIGTSFTAYSNAEAARAGVTAEKLSAIKDDDYASSVGSLTAGETYHYYAIVVYMDEEVGNEANYDITNLDTEGHVIVPTINLGVNLKATQQAYEKDQFDINYDKSADDAYENGVNVPTP